jgi:hypothetical protein
VRQFRLKKYFASKQNEAKKSCVLACSSENKGPIFFSLGFGSSAIFPLIFRFKMKIFVWTFSFLCFYSSVAELEP